MPTTDITSISKAINSGNVSSLYYFFGQDSAAVESFTNKLIKKLCPPDAQFMNFHKFDGKNLDIASLLDSCEAIPMFAERVVIAINDLRMEDVSKQDGDDLRKILSSLPETTTVIIYATGVDLYKNKRSLTDRNKRFCDFCAKHGAAVEFSFKSPHELGKSITAALGKSGLGISKRDSEYLAEICLCRSAFIKQELDKLTAYCMGRTERTVTREDIETLCVKHIESDGYDLALNILNNNARAVFNRISELDAQNYDAYEIVSIIGFSLSDIYRAKLARSAGIGYQQAAADFGYAKNREFAVRKAYDACGNISLSKIRNTIAIFAETDIALKTRSLDTKGSMLLLEQNVARCLMLESRR